MSGWFACVQAIRFKIARRPFPQDAMSTVAAPRKRRLLWLGGLLAGGLLAWAYFHLPILAYHVAPEFWHASEQREGSIWLPDYHVVIQAHPVEGVAGNLSGLTFNDETGTLFAAINRPARVVELTIEGELLRSIDVDGVRDMESITHVGGSRFVVADERSNGLYAIELEAQTTQVEAHPMGQLPVRSVHRNQGVEALSWDEHNNRLLVGQERFPVRVLSLENTPGLSTPTGADPGQDWLRCGFWSWFIGDLSGLTTHRSSGNLLVLSDQSAVLIEYSRSGQPISMLPLWQGQHGLERRVPQAEGVAMAPDGTLFVVSEPNLFYRFEKPATALADAET